jgi:hypothetical protein
MPQINITYGWGLENAKGFPNLAQYFFRHKEFDVI